jgi:hypothetical protein
LLAHCDTVLAVLRLRPAQPIFGLIARSIQARAAACGDAKAIDLAEELLGELEEKAVRGVEAAQQSAQPSNYLLLYHAQQFIDPSPTESTRMHQVDVNVPEHDFEGEDDDDEEDTRSEELTLPLVPTNLPMKQTGAKRIADVSIDKNKRRRT